MQVRKNQGSQRGDENGPAASLQLVWDRLRSRMGNIGTYHLLQVNGQRKFFDPLDDSPPMAEGCEVFVGRIPKDMFEDELVPLFAHYGPIHEMRLMMNFSGLNRGFAFVMYKKPRYAEEAIRKLNDFEVRRGQFIGVIQSVNNRRLYIGKLHLSGVDESELLKLLSALTEGLETVTLHAVKKMNKGKAHEKYAIAVYVSHRHAAMARRYLILRKDEIFQESVVVDWACPSIRIDTTNSSPVREINENRTVGAPPKAEVPDVVLQHTGPPIHAIELRKPRRTEVLPSKPKLFLPVQLHNRFQKDEKFVGYAGTYGIRYYRLPGPLYTLSPVPKQNNFLHHSPPPSIKKPGESWKASNSSDPPDMERQRPKEKSVRNRRAIPRFAPMTITPGQT